jgi:hypothetical protein
VLYYYETVLARVMVAVKKVTPDNAFLGVILGRAREQ